MKISAIIPAAGSSSRYSAAKNKLLEEIKGVPVIIRTLREVCVADEVEEIIICASEWFIEPISRMVRENNITSCVKVILGGKTRQESVFNGLKELERTGKPDFVLIHDGARPLVSPDIIKNTIETSRAKGSSVTAVPAKDTIKRVELSTGEILETLNRDELWNTQTPQVFKFEDILRVHQEFKGQNFTDDAALMEKAGCKVFVSMGSYENIKITTKEDIQIAESFVRD